MIITARPTTTATAHRRGPRRVSHSPLRAVALAGALAAAGLGPVPAGGQSHGWSVRLEPAYVSPYGHDQHVLTIHEIDLGTGADSKTAVTLDTESRLGYRTEVRYTRGRWSWGADLLLFVTSQEVPDLAAAAGGDADEVVFEVADRRFTSSTPEEVLFYRVLEDTDVATWTVDLFGARTLLESSGDRLALLMGIRFGDFDNDYRAVVGVEGVRGARLDASSNYGRMTGPLVGLTGTVGLGRSSLDGYLGQSVIMGDVELVGSSREFTGPFSDTPSFVSEETIHTTREIAIPITELRIRWTYDLFGHVAVGAGVHASSWWDVTVPPGVLPVDGGDQALHENTIVFFGIFGAVEITF